MADEQPGSLIDEREKARERWVAEHYLNHLAHGELRVRAWLLLIFSLKKVCSIS